MTDMLNLTKLIFQVTFINDGLRPGQTYVVTLSSRIKGRPGQDFNAVQKSITLGAKLQ